MPRWPSSSTIARVASGAMPRPYGPTSHPPSRKATVVAITSTTGGRPPPVDHVGELLEAGQWIRGAARRFDHALLNDTSSSAEVAGVERLRAAGSIASADPVPR
jgi:hypothetical protein